MSEPRRADKRTKTFDALIAGLEEAGRTIEGVRQEMARREHAHRRQRTTGQPFVPDRTLRRYLQEGCLPITGREDTARHIATLASLTADPDVVLRVYQEELFEARKASGLDGRDPGASPGSVSPPVRTSIVFPRVWFGTIRAQENRTYSSLDTITFTQFDEDDVAGFIHRTQPRRETNLMWRFAGTRYGLQGLYLTFVPIEGDFESRGVIVMALAGTRPMTYVGNYIRPYSWAGAGTRDIQREYVWTQTPPQAALEDVAVIDVDGTLRRGWTVFGWVQFLADAGYEGSHEALGDLLIRKEKYTRGELSHDELAAECAQRYAVFEAELPRSELKQEARVYAQQSLATDFYEYGPQVIELIRDRSVAPILVTGAPAVVATEYAAGLGVDEVHALECEAGEVRRNWGLAAEKRKLCNELVQNGRVVVVGIGDSTSDRAMLAAAQVRIVMGSKLVTPDDWPSERLLRIDETTEPELVSEWLAQRLEESTL